MTFRYVLWMADGRRRHEWKMAARLCAVTANTAMGRKRTAKEEHYDPYHEPAKTKPKYVKGNIKALKVFLPKRPKKKPCQPQQSEPAPPTSN